MLKTKYTNTGESNNIAGLPVASVNAFAGNDRDSTNGANGDYDMVDLFHDAQANEVVTNCSSTESGTGLNGTFCLLVR